MKKLSTILILLFIIGSCSLEPKLADETDTEATTIDNFRNMMDGSYLLMAHYNYWGRNMIIAGEVRTDNTFANGHSGRYRNWSQMNIDATDSQAGDLFKQAYATIAAPAIIINSDLNKIDADEKDINYILGEAYTARAFAHFDLLRIFGQQYIADGEDLGISYIEEYKGSKLDVPRGTIAGNKENIYQDIDRAIAHFEDGDNSEYSNSKVRFNLDAAYALKSRVATYFKDYAISLEASEKIIDKYPITNADDFVNYWAQDSPGEASIFELAQSSTENQGQNNLGYIYRGDVLGDIVPFKNVISDIGFEDGDIRVSSEMITQDKEGVLRNYGKYPDDDLGSDNIKVFRIEEIVLNYAEALLLKENSERDRALEVLNRIPIHRNANVYTEINLENILEERRKEFLFEGFRFHDLARTGQKIRNMDPTTENNHGEIESGDYRFAMPIPRHEVDANKEMKQNPGY